VELVLVVGVEAPAIGQSVEAPAGVVEAPMGATEVLPQPSRKRKRRFSNLRYAASPLTRPRFQEAVVYFFTFLLVG
jgi:hypothetical protein